MLPSAPDLESITVAADVLEVWARGCVRVGESVDPLLMRAGISPEERADPHARVSLEIADRLWEVLIEHTGEECIGLRCASRLDIEVWGAYGQAVRASSTVRETVENANRHLRLLHDVAQFRLCEDDDQTRIIYEYVGTERRPRLQAAALMVVGTVELFRRLLVSQWSPICVTFDAATPTDTSPYEEVLRVPVHFDQEENAVVFDRALLDEALLSGDPALSAMYRARADELLSRRRQDGGHDGSDALVKRVLAAVRGSLGTDASIDSIAKKVGMSGRTLQRRLRTADTTFQILLDRTRYEITLALLKSGARVDDLPPLLGYSDLTVFRRAFKRWTNQSPGEFQREHALG